MAAKNVMCARLKQELPAIDETTAEGRQALRMCLLFGGAELRDKVAASVSQQAWNQWTDHMRMVINEFRLDATSDEANSILRALMEEFLFGSGAHVPGYVPKE